MRQWQPVSACTRFGFRSSERTGRGAGYLEQPQLPYERVARGYALIRRFRIVPTGDVPHHAFMAMICVNTQFGRLGIEESDGFITRVVWDGRDQGDVTPLLRRAAEQLRHYAEGTRTEFDLPFHIAGSAFQKAVCAAMCQIPFGETRTYGEIASDLGQSAQAVGSACGANPIPIFIPCHRVLGAAGKLTGFSGKGGVETKVALLRHEGAASLLI